MDMDLNSFFRRFFLGDSPAMRDDFFGNDEILRNERRNIAEADDRFGVFDEHMNIFREMREMFNSVFMLPSETMIGFPRFDENTSNKSPRSIMLKDNEEKSDSFFFKKDLQKDLSLHQEKDKIEEPIRNTFSFSKFSSVKTVRLLDGTVEEHQTFIDNNGNKTTTVRRSIGDTTHEITTKCDKQGLKEREENFMNMDESELGNFEQKWNKLRNGNPLTAPSISDPQDSPSVGLSPSNPSYWRLLKNFFGSSQNDEIKWC